MEISLIYTPLHKSFVIVSDYHILHEEIVKLKSVLQQAEFPTQSLDKIISKFVDKSFKKRIKITTAPKRQMVLTCAGTQLLVLKRKINKLFKDQLPSGKLKTVFDQPKKRHLILD